MDSQARFVVVLCLAGMAGSVGAHAEAEQGTLYRFDFGRGGPAAAEGYTPLHQNFYRSVAHARWTGLGLNAYDREGDDLLLRDFQYAREGEFILGLDNGTYKVTLTMFDSVEPHGPFSVEAENKVVADRVIVPKDKPVVLMANTEVKDETLNLRFIPQAPGRDFVLNALVVEGPTQKKQHTVLPLPPSNQVPTLAELEAAGDPDPRAALKRYCDFLLENRTPEGFFDLHFNAWYMNAYPVRTLLAGYDIFKDTRYLEAAAAVLDKFVSEQAPNGAWSSGVRNKPSSECTEAQLHYLMTGPGWTNLADVGCMSTCLPVAYPYVDDSRKERYLDAARRFADGYAARWQLSSGAFSNAHCGKDLWFPYSVATGTQAMSFAALYAVTGERKYLAAAERATRFLLDNWMEDGRAIHHHYDSEKTSVTAGTDFGNIYYYHEGILWTLYHTEDADLRDRISEVYRWHIHGPVGLLASRVDGVWWPIGGPWADSKAGGMLCVLIGYGRIVPGDKDVETAVQRGATFLCAPKLAERIGVMTEVRQPWGLFSTPATGFAGLSLAELVKPGVVFLKHNGEVRQDDQSSTVRMNNGM